MGFTVALWIFAIDGISIMDSSEEYKELIAKSDDHMYLDKYFLKLLFWLSIVPLMFVIMIILCIITTIVVVGTGFCGT